MKGIFLIDYFFYINFWKSIWNGFSSFRLVQFSLKFQKILFEKDHTLTKIVFSKSLFGGIIFAISSEYLRGFVKCPDFDGWKWFRWQPPNDKS